MIVFNHKEKELLSLMLFCPAFHLDFLPPGCVERWLCSDLALIQVSALLTAPTPLCFTTTWPINVSKLNWEYSIGINCTFLLVQFESALFTLQMFYLHWGCVSVFVCVCLCLCVLAPACMCAHSSGRGETTEGNSSRIETFCSKVSFILTVPRGPWGYLQV